MGKVLKASLSLLVFILSSCASIVDGGSDKSIQINSNPPGAKVTITDKKGRTVQVVNTPSRVSLKRHRSFFVGERYKLLFEAPGYHPSQADVKSTMNGWYVGNVIFGGLLGILIVDPATGALFTLTPREIDRTLVQAAENLGAEDVAAADARANPVAKPLKRSGPVYNR
jgi:hypothetical protein